MFLLTQYMFFSLYGGRIFITEMFMPLVRAAWSKEYNTVFRKRKDVKKNNFLYGNGPAGMDRMEKGLIAGKE